MAQVTAEDVHQALLSLYVPAELANCRLASLLPVAQSTEDMVERAQLLRGKLLDAIEMLRPASRSAPSATASRAYDCLRLRYVSGLRVDEVARQLAVSPRQVYRDLGWAEEQLARLIESDCSEAQAPEPDENRAGAFEEELRHLAHKPETVQVAGLIEAALATVAPLAQKQGVHLRVCKPETELAVAVTPAVLREVLTLILSAVVQGTAERELTITVARTPRLVTITMPLEGSRRLARHDLVQAALLIAQQQKLDYRLWTDETGRQNLSLELPLDKRRRALIVEDNPGAAALYERYLATSEWDPVRVPHPRLACEWVATRDIDAVVLDIMMSDADGWTVLRALQADPRTREVPVVICSVLKDTELGRLLGAAAYLTKPVSRLDLLKALRQVSRRSRLA
ncbi:MAG: response regulator [Anaerolineae bacterium]|nr:response regulator [Anaerolineae bacterium]